MIRALFSLLLLVHGLIHLMGFAKAFGYGHITQLSHSVSRPAGVLWFVTATLFLVAVALYLLRKEWWLIGFPAALLSQLLIISVWQDARFGTIANCLVLLVGLVSLADRKFDRKVAKEVTALWAVNTGKAMSVTPEMLAPLPPVVQKWMLRSGAMGKELIHTVRLKQKGEMLLKPGGRWMDFKATQYVVVDQPGFNWQTKVHAMPGVFLSGRDRYANGHGEMLIKLLSLKEVVHAGGTEQMNQGTLLRFLGETCWFPTAALSNYIKWEPLDSRSARATIACSGVTAAGVFFFNEEGDVTGFEAMRYGEFNGKTSLEKWHIESKGYREFDGFRIPYQNEVTWKLKAGDFTWFKLELTEVQYNTTAMFDR